MSRRIVVALALSLVVVGLGSAVAAAAPIYAQGESASVIEPNGTTTTKKWDDYHLMGSLPDGTLILIKEPWFTFQSFKAYGGTFGSHSRFEGASSVSTAAAALIDKGKPVAFLVHAENTVVTPAFDGGLDLNKYPPDWVAVPYSSGTLATAPGSSRLRYGTTDVGPAEQVQVAEPFTAGGRVRYQKVTYAGKSYDLDQQSIKNARYEAEVIAEPTGTPSFDANGNYAGNWALRGRSGYGSGSAATYGWTRFSGVLITTAGLKQLHAIGAPFLQVLWTNPSLVTADSLLPLGYDLNKESNSTTVQSYYGAWVAGSETIVQVQTLIDGSFSMVTDEQVAVAFDSYTGGDGGLGLPPATIPGSIDDTTSAPSVGANKWVTYLQDQVTRLGGSLTSLLWPLHLFTDVFGG